MPAISRSADLHLFQAERVALLSSSQLYGLSGQTLSLLLEARPECDTERLAIIATCETISMGRPMGSC